MAKLENTKPPTPKPRKKKKDGRGRKTIMTPVVIAKLEEAFAWGCTDIEACLWAGIDKSTLYNYQEKNPSFVDRKESLKETPILQARKTVVAAVEKDPKIAMDYLSRKAKKEFGNNVDVTTDGKALPMPILGGLTQAEDGHAVPSDNSD